MPVSQRVTCDPSARDEAAAAHPQRVPQPVRPDGVQARVEQRDLGAAARRRIAELRRREVLADARRADALGHDAAQSRRCSYSAVDR